ncbi:MAG: hypothetical protein HQK49_08885 [Oligoflexia bacterium]|nr:hypothetical protein [Oligoflexia bacterium]
MRNILKKMFGSNYNIQPISKYDPDLGWEFSGERWQKPFGYGDFLITFDKNGSRIFDKDSSSIKNLSTPNSANNLIIGNSIVMAQHFPYRETFSGILNFSTAGFDGYSVYQIVKKFKKSYSNKNWNNIVLVLSPLDIMDKENAKSRQDKIIIFNQAIDMNNIFYNQLKSLSLLRLYVLTQETNQKKAIKMKLDISEMNNNINNKYKDPHIDSRSFVEWKNALSDLISMSMGMGNDRKFFLVLSPTLDQVIFARYNPNIVFEIEKKFNEVCISLKVTKCLNLVREFPSDLKITDIFIDNTHYNKLGHKIVAKKIETMLSNSNLNQFQGSLYGKNDI